MGTMCFILDLGFKKNLIKASMKVSEQLQIFFIFLSPFKHEEYPMSIVISDW